MILFVKVWLVLDAVGFFLIPFRKDAKKILTEVYLFLYRPFPSFVISLIFALFILPLTIPYSLANIFKKDE